MTALQREVPSLSVGQMHVCCYVHFIFFKGSGLGCLRVRTKSTKTIESLALIQELRKLVNTSTEESLTSSYDQLLKHAVSVKYSHFLEHLKSLWTKKESWAHCYRKKLLIRGNHTIMWKLGLKL